MMVERRQQGADLATGAEIKGLNRKHQTESMN